MVGEEAERPGRLTEKQVKAIVDLWRTGLSIGEIEKLTGAGRATIHFYTKNLSRPGGNVPNEEKSETIAAIPPQIIDLSSKERSALRPPSSARAQVDLGMGIVVDFDLIATLKGIAFQEGYEDLNLYFRERLIPWAAALKDFCPKEGPEEHFRQVTEIYNDYSKVAEQLVEEKKRKAQPYGTEHLVEIMKILGYSPARIQEEISQLDRMVQVARSMRS